MIPETDAPEHLLTGRAVRERRLRVDECLRLDLADLRREGALSRPGSLWTVSWTTFLGAPRTLHYMVHWGDDGPDSVSILDPLGATDAQPVRAYPIELTTTEPSFGGRRYWFRCPLAPEGEPCGRRARVLYLPQFAHHFGCRQCHGLTYASRQKHRQALYMGIQRPLDALQDYRSRVAASQGHVRGKVARKRSREILARQEKILRRAQPYWRILEGGR